jgi:hypothetical protein
MQDDKIAGQLVKPTRSILMSDGADTIRARDVGRAVGTQVFAVDNPDALVTGIFNMEAYYHSLREASLANLRKLLAQRYRGLAGIAHDKGGIVVILENGSRLEVPVHTSTHLADFVMSLDPADGCNDPGICLKLLQQSVRLLEVLGHSKLSLRTGATGTE